MMRTFAALRRIDPGFDSRGVITMSISLTGTRVAAPGVRTAFYDDVLQRVRGLPNVTAAGLINHVPIGGDNWGMPFAVEGQAEPKPGEYPSAFYRVVFPGYFDAMRIPLLRGRDFSAADRLGAPNVVVINEAMARRHWPGRDAIGKRIRFGDSTWVTVVGVARNVVTSAVASPAESELYVPYLQESRYQTGDGSHVTYFSLVARATCAEPATCDGASLAPSIRGIVRSMDRNVAVSDVQTMMQLLDSVTANTRLYMSLLGVFAGVALTLAAVGIYGVMHYSVTQRTQEIGIRVALGADRRRIMGLVIGQGLVLAGTGVAVGAFTALGLVRMMSALLYGVRATDAWTFTATMLVLIGVATLASALPARRATRIDPLRALRSE
jgi:putative ABC transport system permease protein